jgi:hypothetical protein
MTCRHENVVRIREVVVGDTLTQCVSNLLSLSCNCNHHILASIYFAFSLPTVCKMDAPTPMKGVRGDGLHRT